MIGSASFTQQEKEEFLRTSFRTHEGWQRLARILLGFKQPHYADQHYQAALWEVQRFILTYPSPLRSAMLDKLDLVLASEAEAKVS